MTWCSVSTIENTITFSQPVVLNTTGEHEATPTQTPVTKHDTTHNRHTPTTSTMAHTPNTISVQPQPLHALTFTATDVRVDWSPVFDAWYKFSRVSLRLHSPYEITRKFVSNSAVPSNSAKLPEFADSPSDACADFSSEITIYSWTFLLWWISTSTAPSESAKLPKIAESPSKSLTDFSSEITIQTFLRIWILGKFYFTSAIRVARVCEIAFECSVCEKFKFWNHYTDDSWEFGVYRISTLAAPSEFAKSPWNVVTILSCVSSRFPGFSFSCELIVEHLYRGLGFGVWGLGLRRSTLRVRVAHCNTLQHTGTHCNTQDLCKRVCHLLNLLHMFTRGLGFASVGLAGAVLGGIRCRAQI